MKLITISSALVLFAICFSCNRSPSIHSPAKQPETPKPLQDDSKDVSILSKRTPDDLLGSIYSDLVEKNADLKALEDQRKHFNEGREDSLQAFNNYDSKSNNYYRSAFETLDRIKDTVIKQRLRVLLVNSQKKYADKISKYTSLINKMHNEDTSTSNYYLTLQLAATLPVIEDYQDKHLADGKSVEAIASESGNLNTQTKKLAGKYEAKATLKK